ncbi:MAG TPA: hypothetical protein P5534_04370 [Candidatus Paceibacterota bacterium]|nr:hypothetical protein [Candidatus Paceibacterota bacterium]
MAVELDGRELLGIEFLAQVLVVLVGEKAVAEELEAFLDTVAQMLADTAPLLDGLGVVTLKQALVGVGHATRQAGAMKQAVEGGEVVEALFLQDGLQIELDVGLAADQGGIAEQAEREAVGDDTPNVLSAIQVFLHQGVGGHARASAGGHAAEFLAGTNDVNGGGVFRFPGAVGDGEGLGVHLEGAGIVAGLVAEQGQEGQGPLVAGRSGGKVILRQTGQAVLEYAPQSAGVRKRGGDFVSEIALGVEAKVGGLLAGDISGDHLVKQLRAEQTAFDSDGGEAGHLRSPK